MAIDMIWKWTKRITRIFFVYLLCVIFLSNSGKPSLKFDDQVRFFTRQIEFDYVNWTLDAVVMKLSQSALATGRYLDNDQQSKILADFLTRVDEQRGIKAQINEIYADPKHSNPEIIAQPLLKKQREIQNEMEHLNLFVESILQQQVSSVLSESKINLLGQPIPPVQYHTTSLPFALIISPRDVIRQDSDISLLPDLTLDQIVALEKQVESGLNVSALVVPVGGIGVYPTMVMESSNLPWLAEVISHEWIHNYLTLHPLGILYDSSPEMRTINETTASIAGIELGEKLIRQYHPAMIQPEVTENEPTVTPAPVTPEPVFDYRAAMHETRVNADELLSQGKVLEAENYMEARRLIFIQNGYSIRRLNQAYFAFYGAYADTPGGAAGEDPVGTAVRTLRAQSESLSEFIKRISWITSFERLLQILNPS